MPTGLTARPVEEADADRILELFNARSRRLFGEDQSAAQDVEQWMQSPCFELHVDSRLLLDSDGRAAAVARVENPGEPYAVFGSAVSTHPMYERRPELWNSLYAWCDERIAELVPLAAPDIRVAARGLAYAEDEPRRAALGRAGFQLLRVQNRMRVDFSNPIAPPEWPDGITVRTTDPAVELDPLIRVYTEAWSDHWGYIERPHHEVVASAKRQIQRDGKFHDPSLWFVAVEDGEIVGVCLCLSHVNRDTTRGYVNGLGVRPLWRKRGIGSALLQHALCEFQSRGYAAVELDMDSRNLTGALHLYERAGMRVIRQLMRYEKVVRPGVDLATRQLST